MTTIDAATTAITVVEMARNGRFIDIERLFAPPLRAVVSAETVRGAWEVEVGKRGPVAKIEEAKIEQAKDGLIRVSVPVTCERGGFTVIMSVDGKGQLHGLRLAVSAEATIWTPPSYANPKKFDEQNVMVGSGSLAVPGRLSLPRGQGPWPGVVLLSGLGPFDRDETSGLNKPLKDLAWGLASRGVAVLRFDQVTYTHSQQVADTRDFTMTDEYVPPAVAAVHILQQQPTVDPARIFILGHSMGGKVAPRVAAAEPSIAGLVIMAGDTQPMQQSAIRVVRYLAQLYPGPASDTTVEMMTRQAALVESPDLSPSTPARELPFGLSGSYWLDLRSYDPVSTAVAINKPMLILQGGRDYQVTLEDDLPGWKAGLGHRSDVTIRVYAADNHLFFSGTGRSTPAEYEPAQHIDPAVIADIVEWLTPKRGTLARFASGLRRAIRHVARPFSGS
ncbi:MAG TPA: alpha/beta fold hydrolase [Ktedonobacteraceae bacterium]|nr:alpha/beta fold hydrolase [Ktedonobacteraceae bacterium]